VEPTEAEAVPAAQGEQAIDADIGWKVPAAQNEHVKAPSSE